MLLEEPKGTIGNSDYKLSLTKWRLAGCTNSRYDGWKASFATKGRLALQLLLGSELGLWEKKLDSRTGFIY